MITEATFSTTIIFYRLLVRLYPRQFWEQLDKEMTAVNAQRARQAASNGRLIYTVTAGMCTLDGGSHSKLRAPWHDQRL